MLLDSGGRSRHAFEYWDVVNQLVELEIPARAGYVGLARMIVASTAAQRRDLDDDRLADLKLAVSEACTNAIEAHAAGATDDRVLVRCFEDDGHFEVTVDDRGPGFDVAELAVHPPVTDPARLHFERGLGIPLIRALVDEVAFESNEKGTTVRMVVRCGPAPDEDPLIDG